MIAIVEEGTSFHKFDDKQPNCETLCKDEH